MHLVSMKHMESLACAQADPVFTRMLADVRGGRCPAQTLADLQARCGRSLDTADGILPTQVR